MTLYVGEQARIVFTGKEYNGATLTDENVNAATVLILNRDSTILVDEAAMTWNPDDNLWEYKWDTTGLTAGSYKYRITVIGGDGEPSLEWGRTRLAKQYTIVT